MSLGLWLSVLLLASAARAEPVVALPNPSTSVVSEQRDAVPATPALAASHRSDSSDGEGASSPDGSPEVAARFGVVSLLGPYGFTAGVLFGGEVAFRLANAWRIGAYVEKFDSFLANGDGASDFNSVRFGARMAWHSRPRRVIDPWLGVSVGGLHGRTYFHEGNGGVSRWAADVGADLGVDFHLGAHVAIGPMVSVSTPVLDRSFENAPRFPGYYSLPYPLLRLAFTP